MNFMLIPFLLTAAGGITFQICDIPGYDLNLTPLIIATVLLQIISFSIRIYSMSLRDRKWYYDDITIAITFVRGFKYLLIRAAIGI